MKKNTIVNKEFVVIWIPNSFYIFLEQKNDYLRQVEYGVYKNKPIKTKEFDKFKKANEFVDELWKI